jgi:leucyl aminopeptidase
MLDFRLASTPSPEATVVAVPVPAGGSLGDVSSGPSVPSAPSVPSVPEAAAFLSQVEHTGEAGRVEVLVRPITTPSTVFFVGIGSGDEAGWRAAGAEIVRSATRATSITVDLTSAGLVSAAQQAAATRAFVEGAGLAAYHANPAKRPPLAEVTLVVADPSAVQPALRTARAVVERTSFARTLTNTPSSTKDPAWFVDQVGAAAARAGIAVEVWEPDRLRGEGFNGIIAVGGGSTRGPRMLRLDYAPEGATRHIVLVGKGITFDSGGIDIKPAEAMLLMRKDMGGAAAVAGAVLAAADLHLPVRVTVLTPLAENMISGSAWRPGDIVEHYSGLTSEVRSTDAEGRIVLADALAYAVQQYSPDFVIDMATLTGANRVALGRRIAALMADDDDLADALLQAAASAGEGLWRLPLPGDYMSMVTSEIADLYNHTDGGAGTITAGLFLREFVGDHRDRWAHIDMSSPSWADEPEREIAKGATGWGVRTLVRFFESL